MSVPLTPILTTDMDVIVQGLSAQTIALAERLANDAAWGNQVLSDANRQAGLLLKPIAPPGGTGTIGYEPMTVADVDEYRIVFGKLAYIATLLESPQGNEPPAVDTVRPWARGPQSGAYPVPGRPY